MREDIISFVRDGRASGPFWIEMAGVSYCDGNYRIERTHSDITVIEYVLEGRGTVHVDGHRFYPQAGDVYLLHRGSDHWYTADAQEPWVKVWCNVGGPLVDALIAYYGLSNVYHVPGFGNGDCLKRLLEAARRNQSDRSALLGEAALLLHELIIELSAFVHRDVRPEQDEAERLRTFLDGKLYDKLTMEDISRQIYRSPSQATRIFRKAFGVTPYHYLLERRLETAKLLLINSSLPIRTIASQLCFADEHYFSNRFKASVGQSPRQYRNRGTQGGK